MKKILLGLLLVAACSKSSKTNHAGEKDHGKLTPELHSFHDVMAPRWHSDAGETRMKETCAEMPEGRLRRSWTRNTRRQVFLGKLENSQCGQHRRSAGRQFPLLFPECQRTLQVPRLAAREPRAATHHGQDKLRYPPRGQKQYPCYFSPDQISHFNCNAICNNLLAAAFAESHPTEKT